MSSLIGREVTVKDGRRRGWVAEADEDTLVVELYPPGHPALRLGRSDLVVHRSEDVPGPWTAIDMQSTDGEPLCSLRIDDKLAEQVQAWADEQGTSFEAVLIELIERGLAAVEMRMGH